MRTDDVYFKPGDKVMRVAGHSGVGKLAPKNVQGNRPVPKYGVVYCVEDFYEGPKFNAVIFVGGGGWARIRGNPHPIGWEAKAFRKVEEIKMCIAAFAKQTEPIEP